MTNQGPLEMIQQNLPQNEILLENIGGLGQWIVFCPQVSKGGERYAPRVDTV